MKHEDEFIYTAEHASKALEIVRRLLPHVRPRTEYDRLVLVLSDSSRWHEAHALFNDIRVNITLPSESHRRSTLDDFFVYVAENAAKTAYNCSGRSAPFDDDSFEWLLKCEQRFIAALTSKP
jgi:hypothetical protein